jgi:hypothetical protein
MIVSWKRWIHERGSRVVCSHLAIHGVLHWTVGDVRNRRQQTEGTVMDGNNYAALLVMMLMVLSCTMMLSIFYIWLRYTDEQESRRIDKILGRDPEEY